MPRWRETLSRTFQDIDGGVRRRHFDSVRVPGRGHVTSLGRHLQIEYTHVLGRGPDSARSQTFIRGRTRDEQEQMSRLLEQQDHFLELLRTTRKLQRQALLRTIVKSQLKALSEIAHNVIKGSVILSPSDKNRLKKCMRVLSVLGRKLTKRRDKLKALQSKTVHRSSIERRKFSTMEKMILIPYEKYQRLISKSTSQQNAVDDVKDGGGFKTPIEKKRKLGPPGAPVKPYDRHPKTKTSVRAETKPIWITL